ncbi:hypothetical protein [Paracoccus lutimaris]|uniref:Uncharacterized protein n=1 Tax=Paracoccus lutimaris TaxID=1490030 RepID=A0A368YTE9_9RHOB|nr:hypothetical protein [Paracoccus lutimaris]RCW83463.1 hypothetical protein DFP89_110145 [Paracoccus lutimaris]
MTTFIPDSAYETLIDDLADAFMAAATGMGDLRGKLAEALVVAGVLPEACREDAGAALAA